MDTTPPYTQHNTYSVVAYTNPLTSSTDFSEVSLAYTQDPCAGFSDSDCTTDSISYSYDMTTEPVGIRNLIYGSAKPGVILKNESRTVFWCAYSHLYDGDTSYDRLIRVDEANKEGKQISFPSSYIVKGAYQTSRYPDDVLISGIDTDVGSGSPFAARITASGEVVDYSVLPQSFKTNPFNIVEIGS
jgi:hypothetical protein